LPDCETVGEAFVFKKRKSAQEFQRERV